MRYCRKCAKARDYPTGSVRTGGGGNCEICGQPDPTHPRGHLYSYPDNLLPDNPNEINKVREREQQTGQVQA